MASIADLIVTKTPLSTGASAVYKFDKVLAGRFTLKTRFGDVYKAYEHKGDYIHLPRGVCPIGPDKRALGMHLGALACKFPPRNTEQTRVINEAVSLLKSGVSFILQAGTGFGKTYCGMNIAGQIGRPTLIVCTKEDLFNQWIDAAQKFWGIPRSEIGTVRQDVCNFKGKRVVIAMLHSLVKADNYPKDLYDYFGLVIFDEVHRIAADSFLTVCNLVSAKLRMGLSATPQRKDGKELMLYAHIGPIMVKTSMNSMPPKVLRFNSPWVCPRVKVKDETTGELVYRRIQHGAGKTMHISKLLAKDPKRNAQIVGFIKTAYDKGRDIVVFTDLVDHVNLLISLCAKAGIPMTELSPYISGMKKDQIERAKICRVRVATWGMMGEGTDIPWMDCAVLAMPRSDVEQPVGRVLREFEGKKQPVVFDLIDRDSPVFESYANSRMAFYKRKEAVVKTMA